MWTAGHSDMVGRRGDALSAAVVRQATCRHPYSRSLFPAQKNLVAAGARESRARTLLPRPETTPQSDRMPPAKAAPKATKAAKNKKNPHPPKKSGAVQRAPREEAAEDTAAKIPPELQQLLLNIFRDAFPARFGPDLKPLLQEVKHHLFNRDFLTAFGKDEYLEAYIVRWSPSRALGYLQVFADVQEHVFPQQEPENGLSESPLKIVCLGGGAGAEVVGLAGFLKLLAQTSMPSDESQTDDQDGEASSTAQSPSKLGFEVSAIDIANWSPMVASLHHAITNPPPLSKYASAAAKETNVELLGPEIFATKSLQQDVLIMRADDLAAQVQDARLVTLMFTLNELYSTSLAKTQTFLLRLTASLRPGSLLLVVDSPGSYSTVTLNGAEKKYPMHWLLDHTLLSAPKDAKIKDDAVKWEKVLADESRWFRLPDGLKYPIDLENMRYQIHLYRRKP